jgi:CDP-diacylglycerol--glycerol-3-phosphate 3-phosphatidyltransferase
MIEGLKPFYNKLLLPLAALLHKQRVHPNSVTIFGFICFCIAAGLTAMDRWLLAALPVIVGACMDGVDGQLARMGKSESRFGGILDSTLDRMTEIVFVFGIFYYYLFAAQFQYRSVALIASFLCITGSLMVSYVKARAESSAIKCRGGFLQRPERIILLGVGLLLGPTGMMWCVGICACGAYFTVVQRIIIVLKNAKPRNQ